MSDLTHDLIVIGATAGGLSVAAGAHRAGIEKVVVIEPGAIVDFPDVLGQNHLAVSFGEVVTSVDVEPDGIVVVRSDRGERRARGCLIAERRPLIDGPPPIAAERSDRVTVDELPSSMQGLDIMVIGISDNAVEVTNRVARSGANVVLAAGGMEPVRLSPVAGELLASLERERRATVLYRSQPDSIGDRDGFPMAYFADRRTPDLEFDHIVFASSRQPADLDSLGVTQAARDSAAVWLFANEAEQPAMNAAVGPDLWPSIAAVCFPEIELVPTGVSAWSRDTTLADELGEHFYNATITHFEPTHTDLWRLKVRPDHGDTSHLPGQYATLGLGYWEDRIDAAVDEGLDSKWLKLIRRSYSISSPILDQHGYLTDGAASDELEFYIVLVTPSADNVPALTPRLALKRPGDRIFLGSKVAGRYTLAPVVDPARQVIFLATGTGEAPHNAMVTQLLRKGHRGPIISAVTVRQWTDLGYRSEHDDLVRRYPNYHYMPLPTREADFPKTYLQDVIRNDGFAAEFNVALDPDKTDVFLCGNPAMIGLPEGDDDAWPETVGVVQLLVERGFTLDRRNDPGNIHFEEYW